MQMKINNHIASSACTGLFGVISNILRRKKILQILNNSLKKYFILNQFF